MPKSKHQVPGRVRAIYAFIKANRREHSVEAMCRILEVAPSGYYDWLKQPISNRAQEDARLLRLIRASFVASHGIYGAPRVFLDLREAGGRACLRGSRYYVQTKTDMSGSSVDISGLCPNAVGAEFHTHPQQGGQPFPSGYYPTVTYQFPPNDMVRADQNPTLRFYLMAPNYVTSPPTHIINYCVGGSTSSVYNVYERDGNGWLKVPYPFTPMGPWQSVQTQPCSAQ